MANASTTNNDLFPLLISEIKNYTGKDPLLPWLRGIQKMRESLPPQLLKEKLPRFLQKCAENFVSDKRYKNDLRFVRVWIQLLDFVDDPRSVLRTMEMNRIGKKQALFYQAYGLYYEKLKKFEKAEKMYHLGVQNFAEPAIELQKSYEKFLHRVEQQKRRRTRRLEARATIASRSTLSHGKGSEEAKENTGSVKYSKTSFPEEHDHHEIVENKLVLKEISSSSNQLGNDMNHPAAGKFSNPSGNEGVMRALGPCNSSKQIDGNATELSRVCNDETVFVKFVDTAIVGKSEAEDACHHGLVDPTINLKEAMNAINSMFREPLEVEPMHRRKSQRRAQVDQRFSAGLEVFIDENLDTGVGLSGQNKENGDVPTTSTIANPLKSELVKKHQTETQMPLQEGFKIFVDDENGSDSDDAKDGTMSSGASDPRICAFVFPVPNDLQSSGSDGLETKSSSSFKLKEDTVVGRFVGSAILDEPEIENAWHHGLVDPTINSKEVMDAINSMFGKPLDFVKGNRLKRPSKSIDQNRSDNGFSILPDDDFGAQKHPQAFSHPTIMRGACDLHEPTIFTREAMDDINEMFGRPLDF